MVNGLAERMRPVKMRLHFMTIHKIEQ